MSAPMVAITINGTTEQVAAGSTVADLVQALSVPTTGTAVALGSDVLPRSAWESRVVQAGDTIEVLSAVAGG